MASKAAAPVPRGPGPLQLTDLPRELQKEIVSHCLQPDLICLSLVSKHFRDLAAAELYRNFQIIFPDDDDPTYDSPVDGLAGGLETFVTSNYDYAQHLREISLDTLSDCDKAELAYKPYLYSCSCGKFLNTLLLLTLRKAKSLEKFYWNIRVELSRPVYKALHQIDTLTHLHLRLQAGPSLYEAPPPLPLYTPSTLPSSATHILPVFDHHPPQASFITLPPPQNPSWYMPPSTILQPTTTLPPPPPPKQSKARPSKKSTTSTSPPTLSGFKKLKALAVLDIDDLEVVTELKSCIRNSQGTLTKLALSFSTDLATRARKPAPDNDPDDSDPDDEFAVQVVPVTSAAPMSTYDDVSGPAKAFRAQEERKAQEAVLGRIFDVEPYLVKKPTRRARAKEAETSKKGKTASEGQIFIKSVQDMSDRLMKELNGSEDLTAAQQEILDVIESAARKYVDEVQSTAEASSEGAKNKEASPGAVNGESSKEADAVVSNEQQAETSLFGSKTPKSKESEQHSSPDDIDIEAPVEDNFVEEPSAEIVASEAPTSIQEAATHDQSTNTKSNETGMNNGSGSAESSMPKASSTAAANLDAQKQNFKTLSDKLEFFEIQAEELQKEIAELPMNPGPEALKRVQDADRQTQEFRDNIDDIRREMSVVAAEIEDAEKQMPASARTDEQDAVRQCIDEYKRSTRGLGLHSLSIFLIPVKASVLSRAVDLRVLKTITLLNVGNQAPIWALLAKENKAQPIALRKIFTDNVSTTFLNFVSQLPELHELLMLEWPEKHKPEQFAPRTNVTIDQIRRVILKKHLRTLKRLMVKNQSNFAWDLDAKTTALICKRGQVLEELAANMGIREIHTMLQHIQLLKELRAFYIIHLRNDDTCMWVMRETKKFIIDTLTHFPDLKLEWLAMDNDHVEHIVRWKKPSKEKSKSSKAKGKEKATSTLTSASQYPVLSQQNPELGSDSEEDHEASGGETTCKIESFENFHYYDVWGVRVFKREVIEGRL